MNKNIRQNNTMQNNVINNNNNNHVSVEHEHKEKNIDNRARVNGLLGLLIFCIFMTAYLMIKDSLSSDNKATLSEISSTSSSEGSYRQEAIEEVLGRAVKMDGEADSEADSEDKADHAQVQSDQQRLSYEIKTHHALTDNEISRQNSQIKLFCHKLGDKLSSVSTEDCMSHAFQHGGLITREKTPLSFIDYPAQDVDNPVKVLLIGGIHGDEFSAVSIVFKWLKMLNAEYHAHSNTNSQKPNIYWRVIPVLNPDGLLQADGESKRMNANNIDLNRNFPTPDWNNDALKYWEEKTGKNERRYPGPEAASELETQWVLDQLDTFKPDAVISVHAPYGIVDFDGPTEPPKKLGPLELKLLGTYPGSMGRYIGVHKNLPMLTVELERAGSMPKQKDIELIWFDIQNWIETKVQNRDITMQAKMQSMRHENEDQATSTLIDQKAGD